jgi:hypothetical protein
MQDLYNNILPEPGAFFVSVSSLEMSQITASLGRTTLQIPPGFIYHTTTRIFTPGNYSLPENPGTFSVATNITLYMI